MQNGFFLTTWFLEAMRWVNGSVESVFLTILICTVVLKALTLVSDIKMRKSSAAMARIQPELQKVQKKHANDPKQASVAQRKVMKENNVSMWGSCLPMLITMPLFFCFIAAFRYWGYEETIRLLVSDAPEKIMATFKFLWINNIWQPDNGLSPVIMKATEFFSIKNLDQLLFLKNNPAVWEKLVQIGVATQVNGAYTFQNTDTAITAYNNAVQPLVDLYAGHNNGWFIFPILAGGTNFLSAWLMQKGQPQQANNQAGQTGKMMMYIFPVMSVWICLKYNAAFAIYWTLSSILMIIVNMILNKKYSVTPTADQEEKK